MVLLLSRLNRISIILMKNKTEIRLDSEYWESRYQDNSIGWDLGKVSRPLEYYFEQLDSKVLKILIPGGGNSYEAEYLFKRGFKNVYVVDLSETALINLKKRVPEFPSAHLIQKDFFDLTMKFDLIVEQTFFCYSSKFTTGLLKKDVRIVKG